MLPSCESVGRLAWPLQRRLHRWLAARQMLLKRAQRTAAVTTREDCCVGLSATSCGCKTRESGRVRAAQRVVSMSSGCVDEIRLVKHELAVNKARVCGCYWQQARSQMSARFWRSLASGSLWRLSEVVHYSLTITIKSHLRQTSLTSRQQQHLATSATDACRAFSLPTTAITHPSLVRRLSAVNSSEHVPTQHRVYGAGISQHRQIKH